MQGRFAAGEVERSAEIVFRQDPDDAPEIFGR
jgi:hypothetical protein